MPLVRISVRKGKPVQYRVEAPKENWSFGNGEASYAAPEAAAA